MYEQTLSRGRIKIRLQAIPMGEDLLVALSGGDAPHIGCVTLSVPRPSLLDGETNRATTSVLNRTGHKDHVSAEYVSDALCERLGRHVAVAAGIHVEQITAEEIEIVRELAKALVAHLLQACLVEVDEADTPIRPVLKMQAHQEARLHRAFSIFLFDSRGKLLLQRRHAQKYHSGGLWSNTCCGHPAWNEPLLEAASRRLMEEMGIDTPLQEVFHFRYCATFENGLTENELDHVFIGRYDGPVSFCPEEAEEVMWADPQTLVQDIRLQPEQYTYWLRQALPNVLLHMAALK